MPPVNRTRPPAPAKGRVYPAAIVVRRPTPRIVADPGPTIKVFPNPASRSIRRPARLHCRDPHVTVFGRVLPLSIMIQIFRADDVRADITARLRLLDLGIAMFTPPVPIV